eukprot:Skav235552  [mRNA]  locus=scaffold3067:268562:268765:- [translate_table: standard]
MVPSWVKGTCAGSNKFSTIKAWSMGRSKHTADNTKPLLGSASGTPASVRSRGGFAASMASSAPPGQT